MTEIERQLCDILGLTDEAKLPVVVKRLHDRYGDAVWPGRGVIPCFCGEITMRTREKLGARPDEPVFSAAERVLQTVGELVSEKVALVKKVEELQWELGEVVKARDAARQDLEILESRLKWPDTTGQ